MNLKGTKKIFLSIYCSKKNVNGMLNISFNREIFEKGKPILYSEKVKKKAVRLYFSCLIFFIIL